MNFWRCQCGERTAHESGMPPKDCQGCPVCKTTLAMHPDHHKPLKPHVPSQRKDPRTGDPYQVCHECGERLRPGDWRDPQLELVE